MASANCVSFTNRIIWFEITSSKIKIVIVFCGYLLYAIYQNQTNYFKLHEHCSKSYQHKI